MEQAHQALTPVPLNPSLYLRSYWFQIFAQISFLTTLSIMEVTKAELHSRRKSFTADNIDVYFDEEKQV
jgi:hypothetical protein